MPIRKYLFWGLTLVLIVALTNLVIRGWKLEKKQAQQMVETVEEAKPSSTRVLNPQDLKITQAKMELQTKASGEKQTHSARHVLQIYNGGKVAYKEFTLQFVYLSRTGEILGTRTRSVDKTIQPGVTLELSDIIVDDIPSSTVSAETTIASADIGPAKPQGQ